MCCWRRECTCPCAAKCAGIRGSKGPQSCRPVDDFKLLQMRMPYQRPKRGALTEWQMWYARNINVIKKLAIEMDKPIIELAELMFNLTLQNFSHMLNPRGRGWTKCRVPFSRVDVCERYLNIFDLDGHLRDPTHPRSLVKLLQVIQEIVLADTAAVAKSDASSDAEKHKQVASNQLRDSNKVGVLKREIKYFRLKSDNRDDVVQKAIMKQRQLYHFDGDSDRLLVATRSAINKPAAAMVRSASVADSRFSFSLRDSDTLLADSMGRRRGHGSVQLTNLRSDRARILSKMLQSLKQDDPDKFLKALADTDLSKPSKDKDALQKNSKKTQDAQDLSAFYTAVVTKHQRISSKPSKYQTQPSDPSYSAEEKHHRKGAKTMVPTEYPSTDAKERRYYGEPLPVLFHEPYNQQKRSTWTRRDPQQLRMQEDGTVVMASIHRYKRDSVVRSLQIARARWSIHSMNSPQNVSVQELETKSEYRRVFPTASRRSRKTKAAH